MDSFNVCQVNIDTSYYNLPHIKKHRKAIALTVSRLAYKSFIS